MHVPDGFINAPVSVAAGAVAAGAVAVSLRGARSELAGDGPAGAPGGERTAPLAGLVAAFVFAVQMLNFPVAAGTSGHLLGGALAAILVGPYTGVLCISVVLLMQAVLFADGGLTALGVNITTMGVVGVPVAYGLFRLLVRALPRTRRSVTGAAFVSALVSVPVAAAAFTFLYALGGTADVALGTVLGAMAGVHFLIGIGEGVITALTVGAVLSVRPDLVYGARGLTAPLALRVTAPAIPAAPAAPGASAAARDTAGTPAPAAGEAPAAAARTGGPDAADRPDATDTPERAGVQDTAGTPRAKEPSGTVPQPATAAPRATRRVWLAGLAVTLVCAGGVSYYASADPDGLEKVAADHGIDEQAEEHDLAGSPLADYGVEDIANARLSGGLAGVLGVGATLAAGSGMFLAVRRRRAATAGTPALGTSPAGASAPADGAARTAPDEGRSGRPAGPPAQAGEPGGHARTGTSREATRPDTTRTDGP
ncbi:energy-coupling factor ABC transporter permease [Streptomyces sp. JJ36]|uniref:energy-coupling factor ABC transporter permease n=1 Tax=Streptomyces sp. JJ36 TaxID=2736645 RepID=UPI001F164BD0|nr:energy-coupling factor ABC transporter permease [Streptomyces sp. JJ36]MCF6522272.1 energy-coupling factor ABC transporter permease [Streptomyces sp. JJ36]